MSRDATFDANEFHARVPQADRASPGSNGVTKNPLPTPRNHRVPAKAPYDNAKPAAPPARSGHPRGGGGVGAERSGDRDIATSVENMGELCRKGTQYQSLDL